MKRSLQVVISLLVIVCCDSARNAALSPQGQALRDLLDILPPSNRNDTARINAIDRSWEEWVKRTGELPPDFAREVCAFTTSPAPVIRKISNKEQYCGTLPLSKDSSLLQRLFLKTHSIRKARIGSTEAARRAGMIAATRVTLPSRPAVKISAVGSNGETPCSMP